MGIEQQYPNFNVAGAEIYAAIKKATLLSEGMAYTNKKSTELDPKAIDELIESVLAIEVKVDLGNR